MPMVSDKQLKYLEFSNREHGIRHHHHEEDMLQYNLIRMGNEQAIEESKKMWASGLPGHTVDDPVRNMRYLFVASIALATRFAIEGGMEEEEAYNASDLYIRTMDTCQTVKAILDVHEDMFSFFTARVAAARKRNIYSQPVIRCMDYIHYHLHEKIAADQLADYTGLTAPYLSGLFKKETGITISEYIREKRLETAKNMLRYSDISYSEIAAILAYSSQSHFNTVFKKETGLTPKEYRDHFFRGKTLANT